jgi:hypothetical protein
LKWRWTRTLTKTIQKWTSFVEFHLCVTSSCWGGTCRVSRLFDPTNAEEAAVWRSEGLMIGGLIRIPFKWLGEEWSEAVAAKNRKEWNISFFCKLSCFFNIKNNNVMYDSFSHIFCWLNSLFLN